MGQSEKDFAALPISTLAGSAYPVFRAATRGRLIEKPWKRKLFYSRLISLALEPLRGWENLRWNRKADNYEMKLPPVFILGHWRSGTTLLHSLLAQDPQFGYCTTYQNVFPNQLLSNQRWLSAIARRSMPERRPADNLELNLKYPQEEEFGMGNVNPYCFYYAWYFPQDFAEFYLKHILRRNDDRREIESWKKDYRRFINRAMINTQGQRYISKNPPNTTRIDLLLEMFPDARFIYLYRNPYTVFESEVKFVTGTITALQFHEYDLETMKKELLRLMRGLIERYEATRDLIPADRLIEIRFESFEENMLGYLQEIYEQLQIGDFETAMPYFESFLKGQRKHKKTKHAFAPETTQRVNDALGSLIKRWGYDQVLA